MKIRFGHQLYKTHSKNIKKEIVAGRSFAWKIFLVCLIAAVIDFALTINYAVLPENPMYYEMNPVLFMSTNIWLFISFFIVTNAIALGVMVYPEKIFPPIPAIVIQTAFFIAFPLTKVFIIFYWLNLLWH